MRNDEPIRSDLAIPPGEYLLEVAQEHGITQAELARRMGRSAQAINEIVKGGKAITPETAIQLEQVLGVPAHIWTGLQVEYQLTKARQRQSEGKVSGVLRLALIFGVIFYATYGLLFLLVPAQLVTFAGSALIHAGGIRWSGGILLAVAFGLYRVIGAPAKQGTLVMTIALGSLLIGLALIFSWVMGETDAYVWFILLAIVLTIVEAVLLYIGLLTARNVLQ